MTGSTTSDRAPVASGTPQTDIAAQVETLIAQMSLEDKVAMMSGKGFFEALQEDDRVWGARPYRAGSGNERLGLSPLWFTDGPRGVTRGNSTCFPCTMARGATFDADLELRIGEAMGWKRARRAATSPARSASICCATRPGAARRKPMARTPITSA
jgi:beta-glucosidase